MELEELRKALDQIKMQEAFRPLHAPIEPESVIANLILEAKSQVVQEAAGFGTLDGYCFLYTALAGFRCRQAEVDDLKGMMALLVASLKKTRYNALDIDERKSAEEAQEFIAQAEAMLKGGE